MKRILAPLLGLTLALCMCTAPIAYADDAVEETPLFSKSLDNAKRFSESSGIQPTPVAAAADRGSALQYLTVEPIYTCEVAYPTCTGYPTCCDAVTCNAQSQTCQPFFITCGGSQYTCEGYATCAASHTCNAQWTCTGEDQCVPQTTMFGFYTCGWWPTCWGGPTCYGTYTCNEIHTCGMYLTCNNATWDSHPTCGGKPTCMMQQITCNGEDTCIWDPACVWPTVEPFITCAGQLTCSGVTCDQAVPTCEVTCNIDFLTCQAGPTCWPNDGCNPETEPGGVPSLSIGGILALLLALGALVALLMHRRMRARQEA